MLECAASDGLAVSHTVFRVSARPSVGIGSRGERRSQLFNSANLKILDHHDFVEVWSLSVYNLLA